MFLEILIVGGSQGEAEVVKSLLAKMGVGSNALIKNQDVESAVLNIQNQYSPDLIILSLDEHNSGHVLNHFRDLKVKSPVLIYPSSDRGDSACREYEKDEKLQKEMENATNEAFPFIHNLTATDSKSYKRFLIKNGTKLVSIELEDIAYFYSDNRINFLKTKQNQKFIIDFTIEELTKMLDPVEYFRINRSYIISYKSIKQVHVLFNSRLRVELQPAADVELNVSRERITDFKKWLGGR